MPSVYTYSLLSDSHIQIGEGVLLPFRALSRSLDPDLEMRNADDEPAPVQSPDRTASAAMVWSVRVFVPFDWQWSKNRMWVARAGTHARRLADHARSRRDSLVFALRASMHGRRVANNRLWVQLRVELPDHKGDAINCIDLVCDAIEIATGLNDRWFAIAGLDWSVVKGREPQLSVWIGQTTDVDAQVCGGCGEILPLDRFTKGSTKLGRANACRECTAARRLKRKQPRPPPEPETEPESGSAPPWRAQ